jgi:8-oxo-dGTP pyrophosphatase MutT (NUDIX family)
MNTLRKIVWSALQRNIVSYGIIAYSVPTDKWLLVQRRFSPEYIMIIRGSYRIVDLPSLVGGLDPKEFDAIRELCTKNNRDLFTVLYDEAIREYDTYEDFDYSWARFCSTRKVLLHIMEITPREKLSPKEWIWPKGRPHYQEDSFDCAVREFKEETGIDISKLSRNVVTNTRYKCGEQYKASSNGRIYETYVWLYLFYQEVPVDSESDDVQGEIGERRWMSFDDAIAVLKPGKRNILIDARGMLNHHFK